jgi:hypothetical protein
MNQVQINEMVVMLSTVELQYIQKQINKEIKRRKKMSK